MDRLWWTGVAVVCFAVWGGCRKASQTTAEKLAERTMERQSGGKADVNIRDGKISIQTREGEFTAAAGGAAKIPSDFPADVYLLKGAKTVATVKLPEAFSVTLESRESLETIVGKYAEEMKARGWTEEAKFDTGKHVMTAYQKESEARKVSVAVSKTDKGTHVLVTVARDGARANRR
jgi:hypothetical protein